MKTLRITFTFIVTVTLTVTNVKIREKQHILDLCTQQPDNFEASLTQSEVEILINIVDVTVTLRKSKNLKQLKKSKEKTKSPQKPKNIKIYSPFFFFLSQKI